MGHDVKIAVGNDVKRIEHIVEHLAVLGRRDHRSFKPVFSSFSLSNDRGQFYGFGPCPKNKHDLYLTHRTPGSTSLSTIPV